MTVLQVDNLKLSRDQRTLCQDLSFTVSPGDYWAVLGPNGCGKTTLLQTLGGLRKAAAGTITLDQQSQHSMTRRDIAKRIGILFQDTAFAFPQKVSDYCLDARFPHHGLLTPHRDQDRKMLTPIFDRLNLNTLAEKNIQQLSGGEQRRVGIAALLMQAPDIYLLDEPSNHLDLRHQIEMMTLFNDALPSHGIIMACHDINLAARFCNKILMLFQDGTTLHGSREAMLTADQLSRLYQHPIDGIEVGDQTYWHPKRTKLLDKEIPWQYAY